MLVMRGNCRPRITSVRGVQTSMGALANTLRLSTCYLITYGLHIPLS